MNTNQLNSGPRLYPTPFNCSRQPLSILVLSFHHCSHHHGHHAQ